MCGILGIIHNRKYNLSNNEFKKINQQNFNRGPDNQGIENIGREQQEGLGEIVAEEGEEGERELQQEEGEVPDQVQCRSGHRVHESQHDGGALDLRPLRSGLLCSPAGSASVLGHGLSARRDIWMSVTSKCASLTPSIFMCSRTRSASPASIL